MFDPGKDFPNVADGLEAVTVHRRDSTEAIAVAHALRQAIHTREAASSQGRYTAADVGWNLPASELAEPPSPGDVIVDVQGQRWTVLEVSQLARRSRWRCVARNLALFHGLADSIVLEKAEFSKSQSGAEQTTWLVWRSGLRARIQPIEAEVRTEHGRETTARRFKIFLEESMPLDETMRIRGPDGAIYRIQGFRKSEALDALMEIDAVPADAPS